MATHITGINKTITYRPSDISNNRQWIVWPDECTHGSALDKFNTNNIIKQDKSRNRLDLAKRRITRYVEHMSTHQIKIQLRNIYELKQLYNFIQQNVVLFALATI